MRAIAPGVVAAAIVVAAVAVMAGRPPGRADPVAAATEYVRTTEGTAGQVLVSRPWGGGELILVGSDAPDGSRRLWIGFVVDQGRGHRVAASASERVGTDDVRVGSLVVTVSDGGREQPAWTAVYGEVSEARVRGIDVEWKDGETTSAHRHGSAYLALREGSHDAAFVRYLDDEGAEIARVPVSEDRS